MNEACRTGRVDAVVQSCDKNFMVRVNCFNAKPLLHIHVPLSVQISLSLIVITHCFSRFLLQLSIAAPSFVCSLQVPVGGSIVVSPTRSVIDAVSRMYPGRASLSPILDLFVTLLSWGETGLREVSTLLIHSICS